MTPVLLPRWVTQLLLLFLYCSARLRAYQFLCRIRHDTFSKYYKLLLHLHCRSRYLQCRCHAFFDFFSLHKCAILLLTAADIDWNSFLPVLSGKSLSFKAYILTAYRYGHMANCEASGWFSSPGFSLYESPLYLQSQPYEYHSLHNSS